MWPGIVGKSLLRIYLNQVWKLRDELEGIHESSESSSEVIVRNHESTGCWSSLAGGMEYKSLRCS